MKSGLILEDNADAQHHLHDVLRASFPGIVVDMAFSLEEANHILGSIKPDVALVDLNLPDGSGVDFLLRLTREIPTCVSVVTTIYDDDNHLFSALKAGAQGYLLKEQRKELLIEALKGVVEGKPALTPRIAMKILAHFSGASLINTAVQNQDEEQLSKREKQVLAMLAKGYSTNRVAQELFISHHTVASHIKNIYTKLEISTRAEATQRALLLGLID